MMKVASKIISVLFHPLLILTYGLIMLMMVNPYMFGFNSIGGGIKLIVLVWVTSFLLPAVGVGVMRGIGLVPSLEMEGRFSRVGPLIITGIFYLWLARNLYHNPEIPPIFSAFGLGAAISLMIGFFVNLFKKLSLHSMAMAGWLMLAIFMLRYFQSKSFQFVMGGDTWQIGLNYFVFLLIFLTGLVASARLYLRAHDTDEIALGFLIGLLGQVIAYKILFL